MTESQATSLLQTLSEKYGIVLVARWAESAARAREKRLLKRNSVDLEARNRRKAATEALRSLTEGQLAYIRQRMVTFPAQKK
jgi:hypothetical protein